MSDSAKEAISRLPQSDLTAEQLLATLLELITNANEVDQLTAGLIESALHLRLEPQDEDSSAYAARLTEMWNFKVEVSDDELYGHGVDLRFFDSAGGRRALMSDICAMDSDAFTRALVNAGFKRQPYRGVHGAFIGDLLIRGSVRVATSVYGEADEPDEKRTHKCIAAVQIRRYE